MATTIATGYANAPLKQGEPPDHGFLYTGKGLDFDGVGDLITIGSQINLAGALTLSGWFKMTNPSGSNQQIVKHSGFQDAIYPNSATVYNFKTNLTDQFWTPGNTIIASQWHHLVITRDSGDICRSYQDGIVGGTTITNSTLMRMDVIGNNFVGSMSNLQVWDTAWSESDVQYAYTHPEKLATNNSGTSLTESNLKLWYPMNEGNPRSPQTTVYDAVPRKLGSEMNTNANATSPTNEADATTGWTNSSMSTFASVSDVVNNGSYSLHLVCVNNAYAHTSFTTVSGLVYKISFDMKIANHADGSESEMLIGTSSGGSQILLLWSKTVPEFGSYSTDWVTVERYFTATSTTTYFSVKEKGGNNDGNFYVDNVSVKQILGQNHGTTTFLGDASDVFEDDMADDDTGDWVKDTDATLTFDTDHYEYGNTTASRGIKKDGITVVVGRTYIVSVDVKDGTASSVANVKIYAQDQSAGSNLADPTIFTTTSSFVNQSVTFTATDTDLRVYIFTTTDMDANIELKNFKVREVGVATGWTEADQQLDIPQTALMGGSRKMICGGDVAATDEYAETTADNAFMPDAANYSFSCWVKFDDYNQSEAGAIDDAILLLTGGGNECKLINNNDNLTVYVDGSSSNKVEWDNAITANKWYHIVIVYDGGLTGNTNRMKLYLNGSQFTSTYDAGTVPATLGNTAMKMRMGSDHIWITNALTGIIDEVSMFTTSLSLAQSQELYNDGIPFDLVNNTLTGSPTLHGYWRNNSLTTAGTWEDLSANSFHATVTGSPDYTFFQSGLQSGRDSQGMIETHPQVGGGVLTFDGVGDYIEVPIGDALRPKTGSVSIEFWCKTLQTGGYIFYAGTDSATGRIVADISSNKLRAYARTTNDAGGNAVEMTGTHNSANAVNDNQWHHIVQVWDTDDAKLRMYVDGKKIFQDALTDLDGDYESLCSFLDSTTDPLIIGARSATLGTFEGEIDEFRWYGRTLTDGLSGSDDTTDGDNLSVTLTSGEILKNYNGSKGKHKN